MTSYILIELWRVDRHRLPGRMKMTKNVFGSLNRAERKDWYIFYFYFYLDSKTCTHTDTARSGGHGKDDFLCSVHGVSVT